MTIFLTISALMNIGLGYWLATYLAREKARASAAAITVAAPEVHQEHDPSVHAAAVELPPMAPAMPSLPQPVVAAAAPTPAPAAAPPQAPAAIAPPAGQEAAVAPAPELETEVLAGIEEFRNQLAQMKGTPEAAEPVAASV